MTGASTDMLKAFGDNATSKEVERYTREAGQARGVKGLSNQWSNQ